MFKHIIGYPDQNTLHDHDINGLSDWSNTCELNFNLNKTVDLSFKSKIVTSYKLFETSISHSDSHKDLGLMVSEYLSWDKHYSFIIARAYKVLRLIHRTFGSSHCVSTMVKLYVSLA